MQTHGLAVSTWALIFCFGGLSACSEAYFDPASEAAATDNAQLSDVCENASARRSCPCTDGSRGIQDCLAGSWSECDCEEPLDIKCTPGEEFACSCADGSDSVRRCANGALTDCICEGTATGCTVCHAYPPADPHPASTDCSSCHPALNEDDVTFADDSTHMNGSNDVSCTACHGMPPAAPHSTSTACSGCHGDVVDSNQEIIDPSLHRDGTVQVSVTGGCDTCHGQPPAAPHSSSTDCSNCHWNINGDDVNFNAPSTHANGNVELDCLACHADAGTTTPMNHNIDGDAATVSANCLVCHDLSQHQSGTILFNDPDSGDSIDPTGGVTDAADLLCETCHDGGSGTYFDGATPQDMSNLWTAPGAHANVNCSFCHGYHGGDPDRPLVADAEESGCVNCHPTNVYEMSPSGSTTRHAVVDSEQSAGANLECVTCHEPHTVANSPWQPVTDPDDGSLVSAANVPSGTASGAGSDTNTFCLDCHDGSWTAAINISAELNNSDTVNSSFGEWSGGSWDKNLHRKHVDDKNFACTVCHNTHSNTGSSGTPRGALLYNFLMVNTFPYTGKSSCSILAGAPSGCHH